MSGGMPVITFGPECSYDTIDTILSSWGVKIWLKQGAIITAAWGCCTAGDNDETVALVKAWSDTANDFATPLSIPVDSITKLEVL